MSRHSTAARPALVGMSRRRVTPCAIGLCLLLLSACRDSSVAPFATVSCERDQLCVTGAVRFFSFEGGFWAVRGDDSVTYEPMGGLPAEFREEGVRVHLVARERRDIGTYRMAGPVVEIISIKRLP